MVAAENLKRRCFGCALFSLAVDNFLLTNATPEEIIEYRKTEVAPEVMRVITALKGGKKPYCDFTVSYDDAIALIKEREQDED